MTIIHDKRLPPEYLEGLKGHFPGADLLAFGGMPGAAYESISCHPDIFLFELDPETVIYAPGVDPYLLGAIRKAGIKTVAGSEIPGGAYPGTVRYNAVRVGDNIICSWGRLDIAVRGRIIAAAYNVLDVGQGYARCSVLKLSEKALVTSDRGIARSAENAGLEAMLISGGGVVLPGQEHGFIGGASGYCGREKVIVLGDLESHTDGHRIRAFASERGVKLLEMPGLPLYDAGSVIICGGGLK